MARTTTSWQRDSSLNLWRIYKGFKLIIRCEPVPPTFDTYRWRGSFEHEAYCVSATNLRDAQRGLIEMADKRSQKTA